MASQEMDDDIIRPIIGMVLGTTNMSIGRFHNDEVEVIADAKGNRLTPAVVSFVDDGLNLQTYVGEDALTTNNKPVTGIKNLIGVTPVGVQLGTGDDVEHQSFSAIRMAAILIEEMRLTAERFCGQDVTEAVIAIPPDFSDEQKQALDKAAKRGELDVVYFVPEPIAACLAHGLYPKGPIAGSGGHVLGPHHLVLVFHCGGATSSATVVEIVSGEMRIAKHVIDKRLGGGNFDDCLLRCCQFVLRDQFPRGEIPADILAIIRQAVPAAKHRLSKKHGTLIAFDHNGNDYKGLVLRSAFEDESGWVYGRIRKLITESQSGEKVRADQISSIILTGGSTNMMKVRDSVEDICGKGKILKSSQFPPELAVLHGAVTKAALMSPHAASCPDSAVKEEDTASSSDRDSEAAAPLSKRIRIEFPQLQSLPEDGEVIVGIDLGTTNSCIGIWEAGRVKIIENDDGKRTTPSFVAFTESSRLVGEEAKSNASLDPKNTVYEAKRLIGRKFSDETVQQDRNNWPFMVVKQSDKDRPVIQIRYQNEEKLLCAEEISSAVLSQLKADAEKYTGKTISKAVITAPAYFDFSQRYATRVAAEIAGLEAVAIINEPTAAAVAYAFERLSDGSQKNLMVIDLGGGTFDVTILQVKDKNFTVLATGGDTHLGGQDFTKRIVDDCVQKIIRKHAVDIRFEPKGMERLKKACEAAKLTLSEKQRASFSLQKLIRGSRSGKKGVNFKYSITRSEFESMCPDLYMKIRQSLNQALRDSELTLANSSIVLDEIILVGGATRMSKIRDMVKKKFVGKVPKLDINPDEAVAYGAVIWAALLSGNRSNATTGRKQVFSETHVSCMNDITRIRDVTPLSLGTKVNGGIMHVIIKKNTQLPYALTKEYETIADNQTFAVIDAFQGERPLADDNLFLGSFNLMGITPAPRGVSWFQVQFQIDSDGILTVKSRTNPNSEFEELVIGDFFQSYLTPSDIKRMTETAKQMRHDDQREVKRIRLRNMLEEVCHDHRWRARRPSTCDHTLDWMNRYPGATIKQLHQKLNAIGKGKAGRKSDD